MSDVLEGGMSSLVSGIWWWRVSGTENERREGFNVKKLQN